jgi:hypothetical protein
VNGNKVRFCLYGLGAYASLTPVERLLRKEMKPSGEV